MQLLTAQTNCKFVFYYWQIQSITDKLHSNRNCMTQSRTQTPQITRTSGVIEHWGICTRAFVLALVRAYAHLAHKLHLLRTCMNKYCTKDYTQTRLSRA